MESRSERRLRCWESVFHKGIIEGPCPVCCCSTIRYSSTSGNTFQQLHIVPASKNGSDQSWNLVPGCGCNQNMRHMNLVDWMGTKGNKKQLLKELFLCKYKSLVAPCNRTTHDREQLIKWVYTTYHPQQLEEYREWMILLEEDLVNMQRDGVVFMDVKIKEEVKNEEVRVTTIAPDIEQRCSQGNVATTTTIPTETKEKACVGSGVLLERPSPYFVDPSRYKSHGMKQRFGNIHMPYPT